jgi:predicted enzyme related to lactoylglutathione lyase
VRDPFTDLRDAGAPVAPEPAFAARLRARLERALAMPKGVTPVTTTDAERQAAARSAVVPYLAVDDARRAIEWYVDVFGAELGGDPIEMPDGRIGHAELTVAGAAIYLADAHPEIGVTAPRPGEATVSLMLPVHDADEVRRRALAAGATGDREPYDGYGRRNAWIVDPFGHRWGLHSPLRAASVRYQQGDVAFVSLWVPDPARAARFYAHVLGWRYGPAHGDNGGLVDGATPATGMWRTTEALTLFCCYAVDDVRSAIERVRAAGGTAGDPVEQPHRVTADCTDDQGTRFALFEAPGDAVGPRPPVNGARQGDLAYLTLEVVDSARARAFYGAVLGWTFAAGRIEDGWQVEATTPMIGLSGGHQRATGVPMWRVGDIERAVAAVRKAGGTASEPERAPYGLTSGCVDDQGMRFFLGEL